MTTICKSTFKPALATAMVCLFASGFLSLAYEVCWIRKASLVFGGSAFALSTVLGVFFAGLALGSYLSGRYLRRANRPLMIYAIIELVLGGLVILSPASFSFADQVFGWLYPWLFEHFWALCASRLVLVAGVLLLPAALMGATLPLFCRCFIERAADVQVRVGLLYGANTFGAAVGCATCGFLLLPTIGADATLWLGGMCNVLLAGIAWAALSARSDMKHFTPSIQPGTESALTTLPSPRRHAAVAALFFLTGFVALAHEVIWARFLSLLIHNTVYTYTLTLTVVLSGIVLGSLLSVLPLFRTIRPAMLLGGTQVATSIVVLGTLFLPVELWHYLRGPESIAGQLSLVAILMLPGAVLSGIAFPLAARLIIHHVDDTAARIGWLSAINTSGGIAASLLVGFIMIPVAGLHLTILCSTAASLVGGLIAWWCVDEQLSRRSRISLSIIACGLWFLIPMASGTRLPADFLGAQVDLVELREGLTGNLVVARDGTGLRLEVDRLWQGGTNRTHQVVAAHLPMALHDNPTRILVVGLGPGQTASRFLMYPIEQLDCVEIEAQLLELIPRYFNGAWLKDPRVRCIVEDGRNFVCHTDQQYDVISVEVGQAFRPGVSAFYTRDFYARARQKLRSSGLITQFVSIEFFNDAELRTVIATFADVFPECALFHNRAELLLVGKREGKLSLSESWARSIAASAELQRDLDFCYWGAADTRVSNLGVFAANFLSGAQDLKRLAAGASIAKDDVPWLEFSTSAHSTPSVGAAKNRIESHMTPVRAIFDSLDCYDEDRITTIRQRNLDTLLCDESVWQAQGYRRNGLLEEALAELRYALHLNPDHVSARVLLADILVQQGLRSFATEELWAAKLRNPELPQIGMRLKALAAFQGQDLHK